MSIWERGDYTAMIMSMFRFMMMMDAFSFNYVVGMMFSQLRCTTRENPIHRTLAVAWVKKARWC